MLYFKADPTRPTIRRNRIFPLTLPPAPWSEWERGVVLDQIHPDFTLGQLGMAVHIVDTLPKSVALLSTEGTISVCYEGRYVGTLQQLRDNRWKWMERR